MNDFILYSIIGSVVLTVLLNVLPLLFPNASDKLQRKIEENARKSIDQHQDDNQPKGRGIWLTGHTKACAKTGVVPNKNAYIAGHRAGSRVFCTFENGVKFGRSGDIPRRICTDPALQKPFYSGYEVGRDIYLELEELRERMLERQYWLNHHRHHKHRHHDRHDHHRNRDPGGRAVGVPGVIAMLEKVHKKHGKLPWAELFEDAIKLAEEGFEISPKLGQSILNKTNPALGRYEDTWRYFFPDGKPLAAGTIKKNPEFAMTLRRIALLGAKGFYKGQIAMDIVIAVNAAVDNPGLMTVADMAKL
ncbi:Glutathione hydrolase 1 proenzyme [Nymphon striatum]|nr:Glutathione hydrolase 1 proenzyme [Nymphon striatum]